MHEYICACMSKAVRVPGGTKAVPSIVSEEKEVFLCKAETCTHPYEESRKTLQRLSFVRLIEPFSTYVPFHEKNVSGSYDEEFY